VAATATGNVQGSERYVEAAVLLALQTPETCTGQVYDDAQAIRNLADDATKARFSGPEWPQEWGS
jgi:hypothetical protein